MLAANYLRKRLESALEIPYNRVCMHEFVASAVNQAKSVITSYSIHYTKLYEKRSRVSRDSVSVGSTMMHSLTISGK